MSRLRISYCAAMPVTASVAALGCKLPHESGSAPSKARSKICGMHSNWPQAKTPTCLPCHKALGSQTPPLNHPDDVLPQAVLGPKTNLEHILGMFFRDDITSWLFRRVGGAGQIKLAQLKALVAANTETCIARIRQVQQRAQPCIYVSSLHRCSSMLAAVPRISIDTAISQMLMSSNGHRLLRRLPKSAEAFGACTRLTVHAHPCLRWRRQRKLLGRPERGRPCSAARTCWWRRRPRPRTCAGWTPRGTPGSEAA